MLETEAGSSASTEPDLLVKTGKDSNTFSVVVSNVDEKVMSHTCIINEFVNFHCIELQDKAVLLLLLEGNRFELVRKVNLSSEF